MDVDGFFKLKSKTRFRLRLELYLVAFCMLLIQALLLKVPPLDLLVTLLALLYLSRVSKELKTRRDPFTQKQKHILFGIGASAYGLVLTGLFVAGLVRRTPMVWIIFGLAAVTTLAVLFHDYDQLYKDQGSA
jgi:hypothetical protein